MVKYDTLIKVITEYNSKSNHNYRVGTLTLSNKVKRQLSKFRKKSKNLEYEIGELITSDGKVVLEKDGETGKVRFTIEEIKELAKQGYTDLILEHNHPGPYSESFLDGEKVISNKKISTILSENDVERLWDKETVYIEETNEVINFNPFKGVVAECSNNGSRMSLIRKDSAEEFINDPWTRADNKEKFDDAYSTLHMKWTNYKEKYIEESKKHMKEWMDKKDISDPDWTLEDYHNEEKLWSMKFNRENFNEDYLKSSIKEFDDLGFELSMEWIYD